MHQAKVLGGDLETTTALFNWFITILIKLQDRKEKVYDCHCEISFPFILFIAFEEWLNIRRYYCNRYPPISPNCVSVHFEMLSRSHSDQLKIRYTNNKTTRVKPHKHKEPCFWGFNYIWSNLQMKSSFHSWDKIGGNIFLLFTLFSWRQCDAW